MTKNRSEEGTFTATTLPSSYPVDRANNAIPHVFTGKFTDEWPPDIKILMGELTIAFSQLERVLWLSIKRIRGMRIVDFRELSAPEMTNQMVRQLRKDITFLSTEVGNFVAKYLDRVQDANKQRNDYVHGTWMMKPNGDRAMIRHEVYREIDVDALRELVDAVRQLRDGLNSVEWPTLAPEVVAKLPPLKVKDRQRTAAP
ncbi:MAG TPA: hypothetical protein VGD08_25895 [Stellaceae bacterium]